MHRRLHHVVWRSHPPTRFRAERRNASLFGWHAACTSPPTMLAPNDLNAMLSAIRAAPDPVGAFADLIERFAKNELTLGPGVGMSIPMLRGAAQKLGGDRMRV